MNILIDLSYINSEQKKRESVAIYALTVLDGLIQNGVVSQFTLLVAEEMSHFFKEKYTQFSLIIYPKNDSFYLRVPIIKGMCKMYKWRRFVNNIKTPIIYLPFSWTGNSLATKCVKISTIHDIRPLKELNPSLSRNVLIKIPFFRKTILSYIKASFGRTLKNSEAIITISNYVKNDILSYWPKTNTPKFHTVYNGVKLPTAICKPNNFSIPSYILYVNSLSPYKNVLTLIQAYKSIANETLESLVIVGKSTVYWESEVLPEIKRLNLEERIIHLNYVSDEELRWLYESCTLFVTTSTREGFGYTPIEAAICKRPVICTLSESLPEVTQGLLYYYDPPQNADNLAQLMKDVILNPPSNEKLDAIASQFLYSYDNKAQVHKIYCLISKIYEQQRRK